MSEIRVDNITDEAGTGSPNFANGVQTSNINGGQVGGRRNLIINGAMQVFQRARTATNIDAPGYYTADRARISFTGASGTSVNQEVLEDQSVDSKTVNVLKNTITTASTSGGELGYNYRFEKKDLVHTQGRPITVSLYAKADSPIDVISYSIGAIGTSGIDSEDIITAPFTLSTGWQRYVGTVILGSEQFDTSEEYINLLFRVDATVETSVYVTMVQVEEGDTATDFEHRTYGDELQLCKRYFQHSWDGLTVEDGRAGTNSRGMINCNADQVVITNDRYAIFSQAFPVEMRDTPSLTVYDRSGNAGQINQYNSGTTTETVDSVNLNSSKTIGQRIDTTDGTTINRLAQFHYTADAEL